MTPETENFFNVLSSKNVCNPNGIFNDIEKEHIEKILTSSRDIANKETLILIQSILNSLKEISPEIAPRQFLVLSEIKNVDQKIRDFCIDAMLYSEKDFHGEYATYDALTEGFKSLSD